MPLSQPTQQVQVQDAQDAFTEIISRAETGVMIEIVREGKVIARILPGDPVVLAPPPVRQFGFARGEVVLHDDFDEPLDDLLDYQ